MTTAKERIADYKRRLSAISERREEKKEETQLEKEVKREEKRFIRQERFKLKHPKLYKAEKVGISVSKGLYRIYKTGKRLREKSKKKRSQKRKMPILQDRSLRELSMNMGFKGERIQWKKVTPSMANRGMSESHGMDRSTWRRLNMIARSQPISFTSQKRRSKKLRM